jgi:ABC-type transporter Mla subunit MlaD
MANDISSLSQSTNSDNTYSRYRKLVRVADEDVEDFQKKFDEFRKTVRKLHNYSSSNTTNDKLKKYIEDFADTYNSMVKDKGNITDKSLLKQLDKLDTLIDDNSKDLKKIGLKKTDGKLEFDDEKFDDDADSELKTIKSLFMGTDSFIGQAFLLMRKIDKSASDAQYIITERYYRKKVDSTDSNTTTNNTSSSSIDVSI